MAIQVKDDGVSQGYVARLDFLNGPNVTRSGIEADIDFAFLATDYLKIDTSNNPLTGNLEIEKADPEIRLTDIGDNNCTRIVRSDVSALAARYNTVLKPTEAFSYLSVSAGSKYVDTTIATDIGAGDFTIMAWQKGTTQNYGITQADNDAPYSSSFIFPYSSNEFWYNGTTVASGVDFDDGNWHHWAVVWDESESTFEAFVAGVSVGTSGVVSRDVAITTIKIGASGVGAGISNMQWDEVGFWQEKLSANDISDAYNAGAGLYLDPADNWPTDGDSIGSNLIALYHFDEGEGATAADASGNENTATLEGGASWAAGIVPAPAGADVEVLVWSSQDGVAVDEEGIQTFGDSNGQTRIDGSIVHLQEGGVNILSIDGGYVGVKTPTPRAPLEVYGGDGVLDLGSYRNLFLTAVAGSNYYPGFGMQLGNGNIGMIISSDGTTLIQRRDADFGNSLGIAYFNNSGNTGFRESAPETLVELTHTAPYITLHNSTHEDIDGGRESKLIAKGHQSGAEETTLGSQVFSHDGVANDQKGKWELNLNATADGNNPSNVITALSSGKVGVNIIPKSLLHVSQDGTTPAAAFLSGTEPVIHVTGAGQNIIQTVSQASSNATQRPILQFRKARNTLASPEAVVDDDLLASFSAGGYDGDEIVFSAEIDFYVDGAVANDTVPQRISFVTGTNAGNRTERMVVKNDGKVGIGEPDPDDLFHITKNQAAITRIDIENTDANGGQNFRFIGPAGAAVAGNYYNNATLHYKIASYLANSTLGLYTEDTVALTIDENQYVGIGQPIPTAKTHIKADANGVCLRLEETGAGTEYYDIKVDSSGDLNFYSDGGTQALELKDVGAYVNVSSRLGHIGDSDTYFDFTTNDIEMYAGGEKLLRLYAAGVQDYVKLGDGGDVDIYIGGEIFIDSGNNTIYFYDNLDLTNQANATRFSYVKSKPVYWFDASPIALITVADGEVITDMWVEVVTLFDGAAMTFTLGDGNDANGFMDETGAGGPINLGAVGYYGQDHDTRGDYLYDAVNGHDRDKVYAGVDTIDAVFNFGGAAQGELVVYAAVTKIK